ncbi:MAG: hypothetical protein IJ134_02865 [Bacilli bacterium]|nr:hypothetical protein [Bacilli bacterium]
MKYEKEKIINLVDIFKGLLLGFFILLIIAVSIDEYRFMLLTYIYMFAYFIVKKITANEN